MWTATFWKAVAERAIKTFAQALAAILGANAIGILDADWGQAASVALMGTILSVLTSVATAGVTDGSPSMTNAEKLTGRHVAE